MRRNRPNLHTREPSHVGDRLRRSLGEANEPIDPRPLGHGPPFPAYHRFRTDPEHTLQLRLGKAGAFSKIPNLHRRQKSLALSNLPCRGPAGDASLTCSIELGPTTPALRPVVFRTQRSRTAGPQCIEGPSRPRPRGYHTADTQAARSLRTPIEFEGKNGQLPGVTMVDRHLDVQVISAVSGLHDDHRSSKDLLIGFDPAL